MNCLDQAPLAAGVLALVRCDLDVPIKNGVVLETFRLDASLKTLNYIISKGGVPVIMGHLGRPGGKVVPELSANQLRSYFDTHLKGPYELLENLRFDPREEQNDPGLAAELAAKAQLYVNESFGNDHRKHTSIVGVPKLLPAYAGYQLVKEVTALNKVLINPARPLLAIIGGAKIESKKPVLQKLAQVADAVLVGGRLALEGEIKLAKVLCPVDYLDQKDIGPKTLEGWRELILSAKTIVWAGPLGLVEEDLYSKGTRLVGQWVGDMARRGSFTLVGGGDTVGALDKFGLLGGFSFVSTGGSAMLDFLVDGTLPGIEVLE
ncbi:phosphoglycerate kinase [Patescibacteria group bacterium]|nr:phosphoglycerate kinase [Patescibacteria group bacterium]MBU1970227.1 phosphoglycerate kinase [Patescibacteria group bacterium]